ncbi:MAG: carbon-nitrogen hydrolase family protein [Pyrodictiaceae archaeon]
MTLRVALIHMKMRLLAKKSNLEKARKLIKEAAVKGARLVVLPSMLNIAPFYLYYPPQRARAIARNQAERIPGPTAEYLSMTAVENGVFIVAGPIIERAGPRLFLTTLIIAPDGTILAKYRKISINGVDADLGMSSGKSPYVIHDVERRIGVMAEDDIYYPEISRSLLLMGATAIIVSLRIGDPIDKLKLMLLARSIENHVPVLAVGGALEAMDKYIEVPTLVAVPEKGIVEELYETTDTYLLVEVMSKPENSKDLLESMIKAKQFSQVLCKTAKEANIEANIVNA